MEQFGLVDVAFQNNKKVFGFMRTSFKGLMAWLFFLLFLPIWACTTSKSTSALNGNVAISSQSIDSEKNVNTPPTTRSTTGEQVIFHMEEGIAEPIEIPSIALGLILDKASDIVDSCKADSEALRKCVAGSNINLNGDGYLDLVVMGQGKLLGANVTSFWILLGQKDGYRLVLKTEALQIVVGKKRTNGLLNIDTVAITANTIITSQYVFRRKNYQLVHTIREKID